MKQVTFGAIHKEYEAREGDFVEVIGGSLAGAKGKLMEPVTTTTGEAGFAIALTKDAGKPVFGKTGDEVVVLTSDIKPLSGMAEDGLSPEEAEVKAL